MLEPPFVHVWVWQQLVYSGSCLWPSGTGDSVSSRWRCMLPSMQHHRADLAALRLTTNDQGYGKQQLEKAELQLLR